MAKFDYQYRKSINITSWVLQILVSLILLGASAWLMAIVSDDEYEDVLGEYSGLFTYVVLDDALPSPRTKGCDVS